MNEAKTINEKRPCTLEFLLKNAFGEVCHPNAARYMLYMAQMEMEKRVRTASAYLNNVILPRLQLYAPDAYDTGMFDHEKTKQTEANLDDLCAAEQDPDKRSRIPLFSAGIPSSTRSSTSSSPTTTSTSGSSESTPPSWRPTPSVLSI